MARLTYAWKFATEGPGERGTSLLTGGTGGWSCQSSIQRNLDRRFRCPRSPPHPLRVTIRRL